MSEQLITIIVNEPPYGNERTYNGLRLATALLKDKNVTVNVFLMADSVLCGLKDQNTPDGYYNLGRMLRILSKRKVRICACGGCMNARGVTPEKLLDGIEKSTMAQLAEWTIQSDKVINF